MLEDLLLALYGFEGDVFAKNSKGDFHVVGTIDGFQPGEVDILNEILQCASNYCRLSEFCDANEFHPGFEDDNNDNGQSVDNEIVRSRGLYVNALASGIRQLLGKYLERIVELENSATRSEQATFVRVRSTLEPFAVAMTVVQNIVNKVKRAGSQNSNGLHGLQILDAIYRDLDALRTAGDEQMRQAAHSLIEPALRTFAFQTVSWLLRGSLYDPFKEHLVELQNDPVGAGHKRAEAEGEWENEADELHGTRLAPMRCTLRATMCPAFFSSQLCEKMLSVGQLRALLTALRKHSAGQLSVQNLNDSRSQLGAAVFDESAFSYFRNWELSGSDETLFRETALELNRLFTLRNQDDVEHKYALRFDAVAIERCVDELRDAFAGEFYNEAVANDSRLLSEMSALRRFFLLSDGILFQTFVESLENAGVVFRQSLHDDGQLHVLAGHVRRAFRTALSDANAATGGREESDAATRRFEIVLRSDSSDTKDEPGSNETLFDRLEVRYDRDASSLPFGAFVLHDAAITRLERTFRFLLKVRYARGLLNGDLGIELNRCLTRSRTPLRKHDTFAASNDNAAFFARLVRVRHELGAVFNELNYYLLVDSADAEYSSLVRSLRADSDGRPRRTDLDTLRFAFDTFTLQLAARTFFFSRALQSCFARLFSVAFAFARLANDVLVSMAIGAVLAVHLRTRFAELEREFRDAMGTLLRTVSSGASVPPAVILGSLDARGSDSAIDSRLIPAATGTLNQALAQFLLRLDFNAHFTRAYLPR